MEEHGKMKNTVSYMQSDIVKEANQLRGKIRVVWNVNVGILLHRSCNLGIDKKKFQGLEDEYEKHK